MVLISCSVRTLGRSRLLNWITVGTLSASSLFSRMFWRRLANDSLLFLGLDDLRIGDEDDAVAALEHHLARGVVNHLPGTVNSLTLTVMPVCERNDSGKRSK